MQVMVMNDDLAVQVRVAKGLRAQGFQVIGMETVARACDYVKADPVDLLIMGERIGGRLSHTVALAAECANPMVTTMLLTNRKDREVDELYDLLPSLYALVSPDNAPSVIATLALSAVANPEDAEARMRRNAAAREACLGLDWADEDAPRREPAEPAEITDIAAEAEFVEDDALTPARETATWGTEDQVLALARTASAHPERQTPLPRFDDVFAAQDSADGHQDSGSGPLADPVGAPAAPALSDKAGYPVSGTPARPSPLPEVVPSRSARTDWIAAKVRELEHRDSSAMARLHLA